MAINVDFVSGLEALFYGVGCAVAGGLVVGMVMHFVGISRRKFDQVETEKRERSMAEGAAKAAADAEVMAREKKKAAFLRGINGMSERLNPRTDPAGIWADTREKFPILAAAYGATLPDGRREQMEAAIEDWRKMHFPAAKVVRLAHYQSCTLDYTEGTAHLRAMLQRLRAFAE